VAKRRQLAFYFFFPCLFRAKVRRTLASLPSSGGRDGLIVPLIDPVVGLILPLRPLDLLSFPFANAPIKRIEDLIHSTGFYHNKAKNLQNCARSLIELYNGNVPDTLDELVKLPGVGRKTANVVLGAVFQIPGMVVDTHVARISQRLGLTTAKNPVKIEIDLMNVIP